MCNGSYPSHGSGLLVKLPVQCLNTEDSDRENWMLSRLYCLDPRNWWQATTILAKIIAIAVNYCIIRFCVGWGGCIILLVFGSF